MNYIIGQNSSSASDNRSTYIVDITQANFAKEVIESSRTTPIMVDFWASWCAPCRQLTPILEKVTKQSTGRLKLAKVNVETNQALIQQLMQAGLPLQSIPLVVIFWKSQIVDLFQGAMTETDIRRFIDNIFKAIGEPDLPATHLLAEGQKALASGKADTAVNLFNTLIDNEPENPDAWAGLIRSLIAMQNHKAAEKALKEIPNSLKDHTELKAVQQAIELVKEGEKAIKIMGDLEIRLKKDPSDHEARFAMAAAFNAQGLKTEAAEALLYIMKTDRDWNNEAARLQLLKFFEAWGYKDPITISARRQMSSTLFI